ncbi:MAG: type II toxin-antitoxin system RelE/ParE family toxin [Candidatus Thermoplasmatota archaeon]|nr:type II toxin-antitoxin system RelE/ParE family toxin [Candidatus Thermoplasmatota archaeon]
MQKSGSERKSLDTRAAKRIIRKIESARSDPHRFFVRLVGKIEFKLRVSDYIVIADIDEERRVIIIRSLGHRKNIYK